MTSSPYARFVLANIITRPGESFCQMQIGFEHGPSRKEQYIRPVWKFATCLHDSNPTHFPPCSVSTYQTQQHFRSTQPLHPPLRTSRVIRTPRVDKDHEHNDTENGQLPLSSSLARLLIWLAFFAPSSSALQRLWPRLWTLLALPLPRTVARTLLWTQETTSPPASSPVFLQHRTWTRNVWPKLLPEYKWRRRWNIPGSGGVSQLWIS